MKYLAEQQRADKDMASIIDELEAGRKNNKYTLERKLLMFRSPKGGSKIALPPSLIRSTVMTVHEDLGHLGANKVIEKLRERFYFPNMEEVTEAKIRCCIACQKRKAPPPDVIPMQHIAEPQFPLDKCCWDVAVMPISKNGNQRVLFIGDMFTRYVKGYAMKNEKTDTIIKHFLEYTSEHGCIGSIHNDQGRNIEAKMLVEICKAIGIDRSRSSAYHPQGNGFIERFNRTFKDMLAKVVALDQDDWDDKMPYLLRQSGKARFDRIHAVLPVSRPTFPISNRCPPRRSTEVQLKRRIRTITRRNNSQSLWGRQRECQASKREAEEAA
jgi:transposase InsO family protein